MCFWIFLKYIKQKFGRCYVIFDLFHFICMEMQINQKQVLSFEITGL